MVIAQAASCSPVVVSAPAGLIKHDMLPAWLCRWNLVSPDTSDKNTWEIVLTANKAVEANDEVLLSYGERSNDDFFGAYGFVPPRNPHEEMVVFSDIMEALEWHHHYYPPPVSSPLSCSWKMSSVFLLVLEAGLCRNLLLQLLGLLRSRCAVKLANDYLWLQLLCIHILSQTGM